MVSRFGNHGRVQPRRIAVELTIIVAVVLVALALTVGLLVAASTRWDARLYGQPLRVAATGAGVSPPLKFSTRVASMWSWVALPTAMIQGDGRKHLFRFERSEERFSRNAETVAPSRMPSSA